MKLPKTHCRLRKIFLLSHSRPHVWDPYPRDNAKNLHWISHLSNLNIRTPVSV